MEFWTKPAGISDEKYDKRRLEYNSIDDMYDIDSKYESFKMLDTAFCVNLMDMMGLNTLEKDHILWKGGLRGLRNPSGGIEKPADILSRALEVGAGALEAFTHGQRSLSGDSGPCIQLANGKLKPVSVYSRQSTDPIVGGGVDQASYDFESIEKATDIVKKASVFYGADLVGIAPFDKRWLYESEVFIPRDVTTGQIISEHLDTNRQVSFDFEPKCVIVMAFEMDKEAYNWQPSNIGGAATTIGYSRMIESSLKLASFIQALGFNAQHAGNDIGLSVPTAIQAGLGESSRMGLLVTEKYGPRVRLARIYTDLNLALDKPKSFGVKEVCEKCKLCSKLCPAQAISTTTTTKDEDNIPFNDSNVKGIDKWYTDGHKCLRFWGENGSECGVCVAKCVFSR